MAYGATQAKTAGFGGVGTSNMVAGMLGIVAFGVGAYLAGMVRINLLTGQSTYPYLAIGLVLAAFGVSLFVMASWRAKRRLRR